MPYALEGVRVLDFTGYVAGPYACTILADMAAEVVKVESLGGDTYRYGLLFGGFLAWNRGKKSIAVDLTKEEGRRIIHELVERFDVVAHNFRPPVARKLGVDYPTLVQRNPRLVYYSGSGYGQSGPYVEKPGFDPLLQARSGLMRAQGGKGNPPVFVSIPVNDICCAMLGAWAMAMGLYHRARSGKGGHVEASLLNASMAMQSGRFIFYGAKPSVDEGAVDYTGPSATERLYPSGNGKWVFIECRDQDAWERLCRALCLEALATDPRFDRRDKRDKNQEALAALLGDAIGKESAERLARRFEENEVPAVVVRSVDDLLQDPTFVDNGMAVEYEDYPDMGRIRQMGLMVDLSETPGRIGEPAPLLGEHTEALLAEIGYTEERIAHLRRERVIL